MKKILFVALLMMAGAFCASAQDGQYRNIVEQIVNIAIPKQALADVLVNNLKLQAGQRLSEAQLQSMCTEVVDAIYDDVVEASYKAYKEIFTLDEVKEMLVFYNTPVGIKLGENAAKINNLAIQQLTTPEALQKMMPIMMKYMGN